MSLSQNYPTTRPTLTLDFAKAKRVDPRVTFTRASTATYFDASGVLQSAANNVPRIDFDPATLLCNGLLIEESRTNSIRNNTMQGAVAGTPGTNPTNWTVASSATGLTKEIVGTGTESGITYIDIRYSGTSTSSGTVQINPETTTGVAALTGQTWTASNYLKLAGGTFPGGVSIIWQERDSGGVSVSTNSVIISTPTTAALNTQRYSDTRTLSGGASVAYVTARIDVNIPNATVVDFTLRIGLPQLELGAFATSVIPTTTTSLTRSADAASVNTLSPWYNESQGTLYVDFAGRVAGTQPYLYMLSNTGETERIYHRYLSGQYQSVVRVANVDIANVYNSSEGSAVNAKTATAYDSSQLAISTNGQAVTGFAVASLSSVPSGLNKFWLGSFAGSAAFANGHLRRITYYNTRLPDAQLQALTAP